MSRSTTPGASQLMGLGEPRAWRAARTQKNRQADMKAAEYIPFSLDYSFSRFKKIKKTLHNFRELVSLTIDFKNLINWKYWHKEKF